jgi:F-type H+-transporting ATPase subunit b
VVLDLSFNATVAAQVFHFLILLALLRIFAYRPLLKVLDDRKRLVAEQAEATERDREEAGALRRRQEEILADARERAGAIVAQAEAEARERAREILSQAESAARDLKTRTMAEIEQERADARAGIRAELTELVLLTTERVVGRVINQEDHRRLVRESFGELGQRQC